MKKKTIYAALCYVAFLVQFAHAQDLRITVDRASGAVSLDNTGTAPSDLKGYTIGSLGNFLSTENWSSIADGGASGWLEANPSTTYLSELNQDDSLSIPAGGSVSLGNAYVVGAHQPDLFFEFITTERIAMSGSILYTGPANDLAVYVDPSTGEASIANLSPFLDPLDVKGYSILSASAGLATDTWSSIAASAGNGWLEANPTPEHLSELNRDGLLTFGNENPVSIGQILPAGSDVRDLVFEYFTAAGEVRVGSVEYIALPGGGGSTCDPNTGGDIDGNGSVEFADFLVLSGNFGTDVSGHEQGDIDCNGRVEFADFLVLSGNFGQQVGAQSVPEPAGFAMLGLAGVLTGLLRKRRS